MSDTLTEIAHEIARGLWDTWEKDGQIIVRTSVMLPSGDGIMISIQKDAGRFYQVSDLCIGHQEADRLELGKEYEALASNMAKGGYVRCDHGAIVIHGVDRKQLTKATIMVANAVARLLLTAQLYGIQALDKPALIH